VLAYLADENLDGNVVRGLLRRKKDLNIVRVQDVGLSGAKDVPLLEWAALENRVLLTHDVRTITRHAYARVEAGLRMPGVVEVNSRLSIGQVIDDLLLLAECSHEQEWEGRIIYLPL
jgi:hypothetical protein